MKRPLLLVLLALLVALPLTATAQDSETVVIRGFGNITSFNPLFTNDGASLQAYAILWPAPFDVDRDTGAPVPGLTSWTISDDGLTYTFTIRDDANWSDGTPITSADFKFVVDAIKDPDVASVLEPNVELIESINVIDDKTFEVVLSSADCAALSNIGGLNFLPSHRFAADFSDIETNDLNTNPDISGGPYILEDWAPDEYQSYTANPTFFRGTPGIPRLINRVIGEQAVALQSIQAGEIDYTYFQGDLFQQIQNTDNLQWEIFPQMSVNFLSLNWADPNAPQPGYDADGNATQAPHPIFSDVNVRKAVAMGYNKADILATLGGDQGGTPLIGPVNPALGWAYASDIEPYPYDPDAAKALLDEAGWVDSNGDGIREKDGVPLSFTIRYSDILLFFETTALVAQDQLSQIGFDVQLEKVEWANYLTEVYFGQMYDATPMSNSGGTAPPDPNDFMSLILGTEDVPGSGNNIASYVNPQIDELIAAGRTASGCSPESRADIYKQIQQISHDDVAYDWTFVPNIWQTANKRIQNFRPGPSWVFYGYTGFVQEWQIAQ
ncbi:MAG: hypothetical protein K8J31_30290 [Anaerolineae bacterium]|nr:hypothetical protein [Anaerolineae bacterium]